jgi:hypothetical protein
MCLLKDDRRARAAEYREVAERIRELARRTRFLEIRKELFDLAFRYDRTADELKSENREAVSKRARCTRPRNSHTRTNV